MSTTLFTIFTAVCFVGITERIHSMEENSVNPNSFQEDPAPFKGSNLKEILQQNDEDTAIQVKEELDSSPKIQMNKNAEPIEDSTKDRIFDYQNLKGDNPNDIQVVLHADESCTLKYRKSNEEKEIKKPMPMATRTSQFSGLIALDFLTDDEFINTLIPTVLKNKQIKNELSGRHILRHIYNVSDSLEIDGWKNVTGNTEELKDLDLYDPTQSDFNFRLKDARFFKTSKPGPENSRAYYIAIDLDGKYRYYHYAGAEIEFQNVNKKIVLRYRLFDEFINNAKIALQKKTY